MRKAIGEKMSKKKFWTKTGIGLVISLIAIGLIGGLREKQNKKEGWEQAVLFTKWYIGYHRQEIPSHIEVDHEEEDTYVVYTHNALEDKKDTSAYLVDNQSEEVTPIGENFYKGEAQNEASMTFKVEDQMLWMVDEEGSRGCLLDLTTLYKGARAQSDDGESRSYYLGQLGENIYFTIRSVLAQCDGELYVADVYRYDLLKREAIFLVEVNNVFDRHIDIHLEQDRGTITLNRVVVRHYISWERVDALTGETKEYIGQACGRDGNSYFAKEEGLIYEVISPKEERDFFISEYNEQTKQQRLICKVSTLDYYAGYSVDPPVKDGDIIYFMDYHYYLTPEEEKVSRKFNPVYCQVNVKTGEVSRVSEETMKEYFKDKEELRFRSLYH